MKKIKSFNLFLESKISDHLKMEILEFLKAKGAEVNEDFTDFEIIYDRRGYEKFIVPLTEEGKSSLKYDFVDFDIWSINNRYSKGKPLLDTTYSKPREISKEDALMDAKTAALRPIVQFDPRQKQEEPDDEYKEVIDKIFGEKGVWNTCKAKVQKILLTISKYDIEEIEDRLIEFSDEITGWRLKVWFVWHKKNSWHTIKKSDEVNDQTCRLIWDAWFEISSKYSKMDFKSFLDSVNPAIFIEFEDEDKHTNPKRLSEVEPIGFNIAKRFKQLYDVKEVILPYHPNTRRFDDIADIFDYSITIVLN